MDLSNEKLDCKNCYFFLNANVGGKTYPWCFNEYCNGLIMNKKIARNCPNYSEFNICDLNIKPDFLTRTKKQQRNRKIKSKSQLYRFDYKISNGIGYIISRFSHWIIVLSNETEYLFHQNIPKSYGYEQMYLLEKPGFHEHKALANHPMAIQEIFEEIERHDIHVVRDRYHASIKSERFEFTDFDTPNTSD